MSLPTLDTLKAHLNMTSTANDDELTDKLDAAVEVVEGLIGPVVNATVVETHYGVAAPTLLLHRMPATAITEVSSRSYGFSGFTALPLEDYELNPYAGVLRLASGGFFYGDVTVTYTVGRDVSASISEAVLIIAAHLWETQRGTSPTALQEAEVFDPGTPGLGYAIPNRARDLLAPYVRPAVA